MTHACTCTKDATDERIIAPERMPSEPSEQKVLLRVGDLAGLLNCSPRHVWRLADSGKMPRPVKLGGLRRWHRGTIDQWLADGCPSVRGGVR